MMSGTKDFEHWLALTAYLQSHILCFTIARLKSILCIVVPFKH